MIKRVNNIELISNFFIRDTEMACRILSGVHAEFLDKIDHYTKSEDQGIED